MQLVLLGGLEAAKHCLIWDTKHSHCGDALNLYGCWLLDSFFLQAPQDSC